jgi:hypothetical protein
VASKELTSVDGQAELALTRRAEPNDVPVEMIRRQKNAAAAFCLAIQSSGLDDQEVYRCLGIDAGYFSRMKKGEATLQGDIIEPFCTLVNNRIYPEWVAWSVGCTLTQIKSDAERQLEAEREKNAKLAERLAYAESLLRGRAVA